MWRYLLSIVFVREGAVGLDPELRLSLRFLGESSETCHLAEAKQREIGKTHRLPHFSQDGVFVPQL